MCKVCGEWEEDQKRQKEREAVAARKQGKSSGNQGTGAAGQKARRAVGGWWKPQGHQRRGTPASSTKYSSTGTGSAAGSEYESPRQSGSGTATPQRAHEYDPSEGDDLHRHDPWQAASSQLGRDQARQMVQAELSAGGPKVVNSQPAQSDPASSNQNDGGRGAQWSHDGAAQWMKNSERTAPQSDSRSPELDEDVKIRNAILDERLAIALARLDDCGSEAMMRVQALTPSAGQTAAVGVQEIEFRFGAAITQLQELVGQQDETIRGQGEQIRKLEGAFNWAIIQLQEAAGRRDEIVRGQGEQLGALEGAFERKSAIIDRLNGQVMELDRFRTELGLELKQNAQKTFELEETLRLQNESVCYMSSMGRATETHTGHAST